MPRKKSPDARDVTMTGRFSNAEAEAVDKARGTEDRSVFVRRAVLALAALNGNSGIPQPARKPSVPKTSQERLAELHAKAAASDVEPISDPAELLRRGIEAHIEQIGAQAAPKPEDCEHPKARVLKGLCRACGTNVGSKP